MTLCHSLFILLSLDIFVPSPLTLILCLADKKQSANTRSSSNALPSFTPTTSRKQAQMSVCMCAEEDATLFAETDRLRTIKLGTKRISLKKYNLHNVSFLLFTLVCTLRFQQLRTIQHNLYVESLRKTLAVTGNVVKTVPASVELLQINT